MASIELSNLTKRFGTVTAVDDLSLQINDGEFFTLLGPSGCGKTTTLRMIAGLEFPDHGCIRADGRDVTYVPPYRRDFGMVFQNYALFPHMNVFENVAFGLRARRESNPEIARRVEEALSLVRLEGFADRKPAQLSGGQQQRVALARALAIRPSVLLLDEPLSNLDAKLREETRAEIQRLQKDFGITTVYVTHDQSEALALSDRIAVLNGGRLEQVGAPAEIYGCPASAFVARFIGQVNVLEGSVVTIQEGRCLVDVGFAQLWADLDGPGRADGTGAFTWLRSLEAGGSVQVCVHPENLELVEDGSPNSFQAVVDLVQFNGVTTLIRFMAGETMLDATFFSRSRAATLCRGVTARLGIEPSHVLLLQSIR